jgi:uncharacterized protein YsxB (DUF464 family)
MISVKTYRRNESYIRVKISGHSYFDESGRDIICSAVSILSYTLLNSINIIGEIHVDSIKIKEKEAEGLLDIELLENNNKTDMLFENFLIGIKLLIEDYSDYITLEHEEV